LFRETAMRTPASEAVLSVVLAFTLRIIPLSRFLSYLYVHSAFLVNQFTAQNTENMQIFLESLPFQSNHNQPYDNGITEIFSFLEQINLTNIFHFFFRQNTEQNYLNLTLHKHPMSFSRSLQVLTFILFGRQIAFVRLVWNA
jgi:hypothetical protein